jgi:N6-adenosine-specific RNA methylase IME4
MTYPLIYADPPWTYNDKANDGARGAGHKYPTMTVRDICRLPVWDLAADDCLLAMWWVPTMPLEALKVIDAWGFRLATMKGFTWHKTTAKGKEKIGMGHYTRANTEDCLFAIRGRWVGRRVSAGVRQFITAPVRAHSQKPDEATDRLVQLVGDVPRVELFARVVRPGWDRWGNEVESTPGVLGGVNHAS